MQGRLFLWAALQVFPFGTEDFGYNHRACKVWATTPAMLQVYTKQSFDRSIQITSPAQPAVWVLLSKLCKQVQGGEANVQLQAVVGRQATVLQAGQRLHNFKEWLHFHHRGVRKGRPVSWLLHLRSWPLVPRHHRVALPIRPCLFSGRTGPSTSIAAWRWTLPGNRDQGGPQCSLSPLVRGQPWGTFPKHAEAFFKKKMLEKTPRSQKGSIYPCHVCVCVRERSYFKIAHLPHRGTLCSEHKKTTLFIKICTTAGLEF